MSGPVRPPLLVELRDNSSQNRPVNTLQFLESEFSLTNTGTRTLVSLSGGGGGGTIGGSITEGQVAFGAATADEIEGTANFIFSEGSNQELDINQTSTAGLSTIALKEAGTTAAVFQYRGSTNGSNANTVRIGTNVAGGNLLFMTDSATANMYIDSTGKVGIGTTIPETPLHILSSTTNSFLLLENNDGGNASAPDLVLYRNSTSPAVSDFIGIVDFKGNDDGGGESYYGRIGTQITNKTAGSEQGTIFFVPSRAGSVDVNNNAMKLSGGAGVIINENAIPEFDVRMESQSYPNMFMLDAGFNKIFMGNGAVSNDADLGIVQISVGNSTQTALSLTSTDGDATSAPTLQFWRNSASPLAGDQLGIIEWKAEDNAGDRVLYASINSQIDSVVAGNHFSSIQFEVLQNGNERTNLRIRNSEVVVNEDSIDCNFRVEGVGTQTLIQADAGLNTVGVNSSAVSDVDLLIMPSITRSAARSTAVLQLRNANTSFPSDTKFGSIEFYNADASGAGVGASIDAMSNGSGRGGWFQFKCGPIGGSIGVKASLNENGILTVGSGVASTGLADNNPLLQVDGSISGQVPIKFIATGTTTLTLATNEVQGQVLYFEDSGNITLTLPDCVTGDNIKIFVPSGDLTINAGASSTVNGAVLVTRNSSATNALIEVIAVKANTWICDNPTR